MMFELRPFRVIPETIVDWTRWMKAQKIPQSGISLGLTVASADTTPSVLNADLIKLGASANISNFDDGKVGQVIHCWAGQSVQVSNTLTKINLNGAANFNMVYNDTLTLGMFVQDVWVELARSVNT